MHRTSIYLIAIAVGLLLLAGLFGPMFFSSVQVEAKTVRVERGMGALEISELLETAGIIRQQAPFLLYVFLTGNNSKLQAGEYSFEGDYAPYEIADLLSEGFSLSRERSVTIPEGFTVSDIKEELEEKEIKGGATIDGELAPSWSDFYSFLRTVPEGHTLEGFLYPDTYRFEKDTTSDVIVRKMLSNFESRTAKLRGELENDERDFYEIVIMASILEKEVPPEDMKRAAGVLQKRLEANMGLQVDASLAYVLGRPATRADIDSSTSPFNTYKYRGLPPGPIANPGITALEAAVSPEENDFWYYLTRPDTGETIFSRTFAEHDRARAEYLR